RQPHCHELYQSPAPAGLDARQRPMGGALGGCHLQGRDDHKGRLRRLVRRDSAVATGRLRVNECDMRTLFEAEVLFHDPDDVPRALEAFASLGCHFEINREMADPYNPTVFGLLTGPTELDETDLGGWLRKLIRNLGGDVSEWGYVRGTAWPIARPVKPNVTTPHARPQKPKPR